MTYLLTLGESEHRAEIEEAGPGRYRVTLDGEEFYVSARRPEAAIYSLILGPAQTHGPVEGGICYEADCAIAPESVAVAIGGSQFSIGAIDERRKRMRAAASGGAGAGGELRSPMPGKVVKILAPEGTAVKRGQGVMVIEAMKMENELSAPGDGVVKSVAVSEGQPVDGNALLMVIE